MRWDGVYQQLSLLLVERRGRPTLLTLENGLSYRTDHIEWGFDEDGPYFDLPVTDLVDEYVRARDLGYEKQFGRIPDVLRVTDEATGEVLYLRCGSRGAT